MAASQWPDIQSRPLVYPTAPYFQHELCSDAKIFHPSTAPTSSGFAQQALGSPAMPSPDPVDPSKPYFYYFIPRENICINLYNNRMNANNAEKAAQSTQEDA
jgi:hypothetical protein